MQHLAVIDLAYGDSGKGALVDRLCANDSIAGVVRSSAGCQAQHNVIQDDGRHHTFSQFGSGSFHHVPTFLSRHVLVEPLSMHVEAHALERHGLEPWKLINVDPDARVTTPYHWLVNQAIEDQRGDERHGSCGRGIGMTMKHWLEFPDLAVYFKDLWSPETLNFKLRHLYYWARNQVANFEPPQVEAFLPLYALFREKCPPPEAMFSWPEFALQGQLVFEGAQGVLLDEDWGFHPHTTWSHTTAKNAYELATEVGDTLDTIGVVRAYTTRHGAGPFVPEDATLNLPELHNQDEHYQGGWRVGHFDLPAVTYAKRATQDVSSVYVTHVDTADNEPNLQICTGYEVYGRGFKPLPLLFDDFARRAEQTRVMLQATPILEPRQRDCWGESVAELLEVPLYGMGVGPRTADGRFTTAR